MRNSIKTENSSNLIAFLFSGVRKVAKSEYYLRHVCPSVRMEQHRFDWKDFH
jgi:hypothetical protein